MIGSTSGGGPTPEVPELAGRDFDRVVRDRSSPALVAFTADWCAPCAWLKPYVYAIMREAGPRVRVFTLDVDEAPGVAGRLGIGSVPTVVLFRGGAEIDRSVGVEPKRLQGWLDLLVAEAE